MFLFSVCARLITGLLFKLHLSYIFVTSLCVCLSCSVIAAVKFSSLLQMSLCFIIFCAHNTHIIFKHVLWYSKIYFVLNINFNLCFHFLFNLGSCFLWLVAVMPTFWSSSLAFFGQCDFSLSTLFGLPRFCRLPGYGPWKYLFGCPMDLPILGVSRSSAWLVPANHPYSKNAAQSNPTFSTLTSLYQS